VKKSVFFIIPVIVVLVFASMGAAADAGHVGHVSDVTIPDAFEDVTSDDVDVAGASIDYFIQMEPGSLDYFAEGVDSGTFFFVGLSEDLAYTLLVINAITIDVSNYGSSTSIVFDFSGISGNWTGIMLRQKGTDTYSYFEKDSNGNVTVTNPGLFFTSNDIIFVDVESLHPSSGGGGCSLGMVSPLMGLLFIPLAFLLKR